MKNKKPKFKWKTIIIPIGKINPTPENYKLKTDEGQERFDKSVNLYGRAGAIIVNAKESNGTYTLINGNTNWLKAQEMGDKTIEASVPDKKLSPKEFKEFAAMFDAIRAGEVDVLRIKEELGTTADFFKRWGWEPPTNVLKNIAELEKAEIKGHKGKEKKEEKNVALTRPVTLLFKAEEAEEYIRLLESMYTRFKVDNVTDCALKIARYVKKH